MNMYAHKVQWNEAAALVLLLAKTEQKLSNRELSEASGIPEVSLQRYLTGKRPVSVEHFAAISRALGFDPMDLFAQVEARVRATSEATGTLDAAATTAMSLNVMRRFIQRITRILALQSGPHTDASLHRRRSTAI